MLSSSMFRKKLLILVSVGVILPLVLLTYLQYRSLTELENKTKGAFKDNLRQGFTLVQQQMKQRLEEVAAQTLDPIGSIDSPRAAEDIEKHFANIKRSHPEIEEIFAFTSGGKRIGLTQTQSDIPLQFERARMAQSFLDGNRKYLFTGALVARQGAYLFYPMPNLSREQNGFAGVLLTEAFVRDDLIAGSITQTVNKYHGNTDSLSTIAFTISDENNDVLFSNAAAQNGFLFESNFDPPFSNW